MSTDSSSTSTSTSHPLSRVMPNRPIGPMRVPARALGWFSICLGLAELAMPRKIARAAGMPNLPTVTRAFGLREIGTGIGILTSKDPSPWLWGRVVGDALDIATVTTGLLTERRPMRTLASMAMLLGIAYVDLKVAEAAPPEKKRAKHSGHDYSGRSGFPRGIAEARGIAKQASRSMNAPSGTSAPSAAGSDGRAQPAGLATVS